MDSKKKKYLATGAVVLLAVALVLLKYWDYVVNPWTRDGQVWANVIQIAPRVSGPIVDLPIKDNQFVKAGDVLFQIDPRTYQAALDQAKAQLDETNNQFGSLSQQVAAAAAAVEASRHAVTQAGSSIKGAESDLVMDRAEYKRQEEMLPRKATSQKAYQQAKANYQVSQQQRRTAVAGLAQAKANLSQAEANLAEAKANLGAVDNENPQIRAAKAALEQAELNLEFSTVRAPVDGYVTNLLLRLGSQMVANQPVIAFIDVNSYWITGYFRENYIDRIEAGDRVVATLMSYPRQARDRSGRKHRLGHRADRMAARGSSSCPASRPRSNGFAWRNACRCGCASPRCPKVWCCAWGRPVRSSSRPGQPVMTATTATRLPRPFPELFSR